MTVRRTGIRRTGNRVIRRAAAAGVLVAGALLAAGCGAGDPGTPTGAPTPTAEAPGSAPPGGLEEQAEVGGVQPVSTAAAGELMDAAVTDAGALMQSLGGEWTFLDGADYDPELVGTSSAPQACTTRDSGGGLVRGGQYQVAALTKVPDETPEETLERFEAALGAAGYESLSGNGTTDDGWVVANGSSEQGRVSLMRKPEDVRFLLDTACSTDASMD